MIFDINWFYQMFHIWYHIMGAKRDKVANWFICWYQENLGTDILNNDKKLKYMSFDDI